MRKALLLLLLPGLAAGGSIGAQATEHKSDGSIVENPFRGVMQDRAAHSPEEALFVEKCGMCHRQMGMGTLILARRMDPKVAMLEARNNLTVEFVTAAARAGIGNMPRISRGEVGNAQLARIAAYLAKVPGK